MHIKKVLTLVKSQHEDIPALYLASTLVGIVKVWLSEGFGLGSNDVGMFLSESSVQGPQWREDI